MLKQCNKCSTEFEVAKEDLEFYDTFSPILNWKKYLIPPPSHCPDCRVKRRFAWRNERNLYKRRSNDTGKNIISIYSTDKPFPVYEPKYWWSDKSDNRDYWINYDFNKTFFEQFNSLLEKVPMPKRTAEELTMENSDYCSEAWFAKDCYLSFELSKTERCLYSRWLIECFDLIDCLNCTNCTTCYQVSFSDNCNSCKYIFDCNNCNNLSFCSDCVSSTNCFWCTNLRNKEYYFFNEKLSKKEYEDKVGKFINENSQISTLSKFLEFKSKQILKSLHNINIENSTWNYLTNTNNCFHCFSCWDSEDCRYCDWLSSGARNSNCMDVSYFWVWAEKCFEAQCVWWCPWSSVNILFSSNCWNVFDLLYCHYCVNLSNNCFWCVWLKKWKYCILNKQYTKQEYENLLPKIIEHMIQTWEWWEFFPIEISPFWYNETIAQEHFPLEKEQVLANNWKWKDEDGETPLVTKIIPAEKLPSNINDIPEDILSWAIKCETTWKPFKIVTKEFQFYKQNNISIPHIHPDERYKERMKLSNKRKIFQSSCKKCWKDIQTTHDPKWSEIIYCEECYLKEIY